jgi:predicted DNA-binding transcriptional regulator YafY
MHRITWFDQEIRLHRYPNCKTLAHKFEISVRQANRDIDYLKNSLGAPLQYVAAKRGYEYEDDTFTLPNIYITEEQKKVLEYLAYSYENYAKSAVVNKAAAILKKLTGDGRHAGDMPVFDIEKPSVSRVNNLMDAIKSRKKVSILYQDAEKGSMLLTVHPYKLFNRLGVDYIAVYCEETSNEAVFRLDRIQDCEVTDESFKLSQDFNIKKYSSFMQKKPFTARIKLKEGKDIQNMPYMDIRHMEGLVYEIDFYNIHEFVNLLFSMDIWEKVYSPMWLVERMKQRCQETLDRLK